MGPEQERQLSDEELVEGGAEIKEGKLEIAQQQYDHLHQEMELELQAVEKEGKSDCVDYIKGHIESDLTFQPQIRQEVAKVMQSLLKTSKGADEGMFLVDVIQTLEVLKKDPKIIQKVGRDLVWLHESWKAAGNFPGLNDDERKEVEDYLDGMIEKATAQTLEQYMTEKFGLAAEKNWDPDSQNTPGGKMAMTMLGAMNSGNLEDFNLKVPQGQKKSSSEIDSMVSEYYKNQGYVVESDMGCLIAKKDDEKLFLNISNWDDNIMVSVINMKY